MHSKSLLLNWFRCLAQTALQRVGTSTKGISDANAGNPEYAVAVSILFTRATNQDIMLGTVPGNVLSTSILYNSLLYDKRFKRVPMSEAAPGDIIIAPGGHQAAGYAGIVVDHGRIVSMGTAGTVQSNCSLFEIQRNRQDMAIFRYIGVQNRRSSSLANAGYNPDESRLPAGQPGGGQWTGGRSVAYADAPDAKSDIGEAVRERLWSINNPKYRTAIAAVAWSHKGDKKWLQTGKYTNKCNLAVADWIYEATGSAPGYMGRAPLAHEWADPSVKIDNWSAPFPVSDAQPGDVIAESHEGGRFGHAGIMVAPGMTASANALTNPAGIVTANDWGFRST